MNFWLKNSQFFNPVSILKTFLKYYFISIPMENIPRKMKHQLIKKDKLTSLIKDLTCVSSAYEFIRLIGRMDMEGKCKPYRNSDNKLPRGNYIEIHSIARTSERIVINLDTFEILPTRDHYTTFSSAGKPKFTASQNL